MKLIAGLGNPGVKYAATRHNIGFMVIEELAREEDAVFRKSLWLKSSLARFRFKSRDVFLVKPLTYMNNSGQSLKAFMRKYRLGLPQVLVICDDIDLPLGKVRFRIQGRDAGHLGVRSIIESLGSEEIARLRIGVGRPPAEEGPIDAKDVRDFVLSEFTGQEKTLLEQAIKISVFACKEWLSCGITKNTTYLAQ